MIGPISLEAKQMGARSAGNPHAACDVEGAGNVVRTEGLGRTGAPVLDPTIHPLGDTVTAITRGGLQLMQLKEFPHTITEPKYDIYEGRIAQIPMSFCLVAQKASEA